MSSDSERHPERSDRAAGQEAAVERNPSPTGTGRHAAEEHAESGGGSTIANAGLGGGSPTGVQKTPERERFERDRDEQSQEPDGARPAPAERQQDETLPSSKPTLGTKI